MSPPNSINDLASVAFTEPETITWDTAAEWDAAVSESGVVHAAYGSLTDANEVTVGYPAFDRNGTNLVGYLPFDETTGTTAFDYSGNSNDGTYTGATLNQTALLGYPIPSFDGIDDYVSVPDAATLDITGEITVNAWVNLDSVQPEPYAAILRKDSAYYLRGWSDNIGDRASFYINNGSSWFNAGSDIDLRGTGWHMVTGTYDGSTLKLYVDGGTPDATTSVSTTINANTESVEIGRKISGSEYLRGSLGFVRIYDRALTDAQIQALYDTYSGGSLTTATLSFSTPVTPNLDSLAYSLNGGGITLDVTGSPGTASEETVSQTLDGSTGYPLTWANSHTDFQITMSLSTPTGDPTASPTVSGVTLTTGTVSAPSEPAIDPQASILQGDGITDSTLPQTESVQFYHAHTDGSGATLTDNAGNGHDMSLNNFPAWVSGYAGYGGLDYNGSTQYAQGPDINAGGGSYTSVAVVRWDSFGGGESRYVHTHTPGHLLAIEGGNSEARVRIWDGSSNTIVPLSSVTTGTWVCVAVRYASDNTVSVFLDGSLVGTGTANRPNNTNPLLYGSSTGGSSPADCAVSLGVTWFAELTDTEIADLSTDLGF